ncbi:MAG: hypothetical protein LH615_00580 [Ferruginibacter sp.]|nr:hypothetical protein [Ferruginibacter sp.]
MARIAGLVAKKNIKGELTHITIDVKKHKDAIAPFLEQMGLSTKTAFQLDRERGITIEEARKRTKKYLETLPWKK